MLIISDNFQVTVTQRCQKPCALLLVYGHRSPSTKESFEGVVIFLPDMGALQSGINGQFSTTCDYAHSGSE